MKQKNGISKLTVLLLTGLVAGMLVFVYHLYFLPSTQAKVTIDDEERSEITKINDYRKKNGLSTLKISTKLSNAAQAMAQDMADHPDSINHEHLDSQGRNPSERAALFGYTDGVGENLAAGYDTALSVFNAWKGSPEHKANLLDKDYKVMGIAKVTTGSDYKWYWVNMFGEVAHQSDLMDVKNYAPLRTVTVTVTDDSGKPIKNAKVYLLNSSQNSRFAQGKTNTKGKKSFTIEPRDEFYVRASATGYQYYVKKAKDSSGTISVKMWLSKQ